MWHIKKRYSLAESGLLQGATDFHCHALPGVDDGVQTLDESLSVLSMYEEQGISKVWLTPHIMEDIPNEPDWLKLVFEQLKSAYKGTVQICLSNENMLDNLFLQRLTEKRLLTLYDEQQVLVETSYYNPCIWMDNIFTRISNQGYIPVLAHPERYMYMEKDDYIKLKRSSIRFQLNVASLLGAYGKEAREKAIWLLMNNYYDLWGSDLHQASAWKLLVNRKEMTSDVLKLLCGVMQ